MVSHNVEEAVYMADRVIVMSPRPGKVIGEVRVDLPRPRTEQLREAAYFEFVDKVVEFLERGKVKVETTLELTAKKKDNV
jgi:NitT/TauT family transport system ATP-binding protein